MKRLTLFIILAVFTLTLVGEITWKPRCDLFFRNIEEIYFVDTVSGDTLAWLSDSGLFVVDTVDNDTVFIGGDIVYAPYGYFTDSLYSPYVRVDTTLLTGVVKAYAYTSFGQNTMATVISGDTFYFTRMQNADWRWYFPDANLYFETTVGKVWLIDDASVYSETYPVLGTPANKFKSSCIDTLHSLKADIDSLIMNDTIVKFEESDSHLYITMADGSVYQCVDTNEKWVSEARVDTITSLEYYVGSFGLGCAAGTGNSLAPNLFAQYYDINTTTDAIVYNAYTGYCGVDSIYIDSTVIIIRPYLADTLDTLLYGILQPKTGSGLGQDELVWRDTIIVDSAIAHNTLALYKNTSDFTLNKNNKLMVYGLDISNHIRAYGFILYSHTLHKLRH